MHENLIGFFTSRNDIFPLRRPIDIERFLGDAFDNAAALPVPSKLYLADESQQYGFGFPITRSAPTDDLAARLQKWFSDESRSRTDGVPKERLAESEKHYTTWLVKAARNALQSSILGDYHSVFWLMHSAQVASALTAVLRNEQRGDADALKYMLIGRWSTAVRSAMADTIKSAPLNFTAFLTMMLDNPLIAAEEFIATDLRELRAYVTTFTRRDFTGTRKWFEDLRALATRLMTEDRVFARAVGLLGYPAGPPTLTAILDRRMQELIFAHPSYHPVSEQPFYETVSKKLFEYFIVYYLRRSITWVMTTPDGDHVSDDRTKPVVFSRAIRPMNFGRRGVVEPMVYRFGLVYDMTSFTQTLGELARSGKDEEQTSYRQMLEFQRRLAEITDRFGLQFEKFLGDGAFYTSRRAVKTLQAALAIQQFYASARRNGFAFNKGLRIGINYGYYRLLPMQVAADGTEIMEFYGPGIVELSRLTTGKATKELEDIQHLLLSHGYDQMEVYRFFAPLSRSVSSDEPAAQREFYAYVNEAGHLVNEGIVVSIPFLKELSTELSEDDQKIYRLRTPAGVYLGFPAADGGYIAIKILGAVSLKGIGAVEVGEVVHLTHDEAEVSLIDEHRPFIQLLEQERNRSAARSLGAAADANSGLADLVVCESRVSSTSPVIFVGEWDPVSGEIRRPIQLGGEDAERYGLAVPLTVETVQSQSVAYQKLYSNLSKLETLPSFSVDAIKTNANFSGFIIGATVERL